MTALKTALNVKFHAFMCQMAALLLLATALAGPAAADVCRWVDSDGTVNYGERAPKNREYTVVSRSAPTKAGSRIIDGSKSNVPTPNSAPRTAGGNPLPAEDNMSDRQKAMLSEIQAAEAARLAAVAKMRKSNYKTKYQQSTYPYRSHFTQRGCV